MSFHFFEAVNKHFTPDLLFKASTYLGEKEQGVKKALTGILPAVLSGIISKATTSAGGGGDVLRDAIKENESGSLDNIGNIFRDGGNMLDKGMLTARNFLGDKLGGTITTIAAYAGVKNFSVSALFSLVSSVAMGVLGKQAKEENLDAKDFSSILDSQKTSVLNMLPANLKNIAGSLGLGHLHQENTTKHTESYNKPGYKLQERKNKWMAAFGLAALVIGMVLLFLLLNRNSGRVKDRHVSVSVRS